MPNVLIVDDDAFVRTHLRDSLAGTGFNLSEAADGEEACRLAASQRPEVILLDLLMPKQSGLEALERIRSASPDSQVIVITGLDNEGLIQQVLSAGARDFVTKPFHPLEILGAVRRILSA
jgi:two-component system chemotaxis response regulator CheY